MQVRQMNYLLAVVECGSFRLAAQQLFMSQPALSQSIRALEEELGFPLLERRPDGVAPTQMGEVVYRDVKRLLAAMEEKTQAWKTQYARQCACAGTVRLGYVSDTWLLVERARARLEQSHPNLRLRLTEERSGSLLEQLSLEVILDQDPDFIFAILQGADPADARRTLEDTLLSNPAWQSLTAVREGRFFVLDDQLYNLKPNARWGDAYEQLADLLRANAPE